MKFILSGLITFSFFHCFNLMAQEIPTEEEIEQEEFFSSSEYASGENPHPDIERQEDFSDTPSDEEWTYPLPEEETYQFEE